jgi:hypothetical protein
LGKAKKGEMERVAAGQWQDPRILILTTLIGLLDRARLLELRGMVDDRLAELESQEREDCPREQNPGPTESRGGGKGYFEIKHIRGHGPYLYRRWRQDGRLRSEYLGKVVAEQLGSR